MIQAKPLISISVFVGRIRGAGEETRNKFACAGRKGGFCCGLGFV